MKTLPLQEAFNAGEFGPRMEARIGFDKYRNAGRKFENIIPLPQGGWARRAGTRYVAGATSNSARPWLIPFEFSTTQAYILELGANTMRFFKDQGQVTATNVTAAAITNGDFASDITGWTDRDTGGTAASSWNASGYAQLLGDGTEYAWLNQAITGVTNGEAISLRFEIKGAPGDYVLLRVGTTATGGEIVDDVKFDVGFHVYTFEATATTIYVGFRSKVAKALGFDNVSINDGGPIEITTPWGTSDLPLLSYAQSADVIYFAIGGATRPYRLERFAHDSWSLEQVMFEDGPYLTQNATSTTMTLGAATGLGVTLTASAVTGINDDAGFRSTDVGRSIRIKVGSNDWGWAQIVGYTSTTVVTIDVKETFTATTASSVWRLGTWNDTDGWPSVVGFIQQRLGLANTTKYPQRFWLSKSADIENFQDADKTGTVQDDSSIDYQFAARKVHAIRWLAMRKKPVIGTVGGEWTLSSQGATVTPTDISADPETSVGVARMPPIDARNRLLYIQAAGRKLQEFADLLSNSGVTGYDSLDLTVLNDRILSGGVDQIAYAQEPDSNIYCRRNDGQVPTLTYQPDQSVIGWARQIIGGAYKGDHAIVESVAAIPGNDGNGQWKDSTGRTEIWVAVKRTINGSTKRYIEFFEKLYNGNEDIQAEVISVDSCITLDSPITITNITSANPAVVTVDGTAPANGTYVRIVRVVGVENDTGEVDSDDQPIYESGVNDIAFIVANRTGTTFELTDLDGNNYDTSAMTAYADSGEVREMVLTVTGIDHLEGETVKVFADGAWQNDKTVSSGSITLDRRAGMIHVGLEYEHRFDSMKLAFVIQGGSSIGKVSSPTEVNVVMMETAEGALRVAIEDSDGIGTFRDLDTRTSIDDKPPPFFSGSVPISPDASYDIDSRIIMKGNVGPCTVLALATDLDTSV